MSSDRREISPDARPDFQALVDVLLPFAQKELRKHGGLYPFGAGMDLAGKVSVQHPRPEEIIKLLQDSFRRWAAEGGLRATGICEFVHLTHESGAGTDAVKMTVEHHLGEAGAYYAPYRTRFMGGLSFREMFAVPVTATIFGVAPDADAT